MCDCRGVLTLDMLPTVIETGARAIAVQFDVWGMTRLLANSLETGWKCAKSYEGNPRPNLPILSNGEGKKAEENGTNGE